MTELTKWSSILNHNLSSYFDKKFIHLGINASQYFYITKICETPGITQDLLFQEIFRSPSNITRALSQLIKKGYITKIRSLEDKRTCHLYPTKKAEYAAIEIRKILADSMEQIVSPFTEEENFLLNRLLKHAALTAFSMNKQEKEQTEDTIIEDNKSKRKKPIGL